MAHTRDADRDTKNAAAMESLNARVETYKKVFQQLSKSARSALNEIKTIETSIQKQKDKVATATHSLHPSKRAYENQYQLKQMVAHESLLLVRSAAEERGVRATSMLGEQARVGFAVAWQHGRKKRGL